MNRDTAGPLTRTLGEILDELVTEAGHEKPASFAELVAVAGLDPARDFVGGSLREVDLRGEDLRGFDFSGADLTGADFRGANLSGVSFNDADRTGALGLPDLAAELAVSRSGAEHRTRVRRRGLLLVLSSPSDGAGSKTIAHRLIAADPGLTLSVSVTTRPPRQGEIDGRDYFFIDRERFQRDDGAR